MEAENGKKRSHFDDLLGNRKKQKTDQTNKSNENLLNHQEAVLLEMKRSFLGDWRSKISRVPLPKVDQLTPSKRVPASKEEKVSH